MRKAPARISEETRQAILGSGWELMASRSGSGFGLSEVAAKAGVSRQTVFLAFGGRAGLLKAMLRNHDRHSPLAERMFSAGEAAFDRPEAFLPFVEAWLDYLPEIYPVGIQLDAASLTDPDAAAAWNDRLKATMLEGLKRQMARLRKAKRLKPAWTPDHAAEFVWSLLHPVNWRLLVVECKWTPKLFRENRIRLLRELVLID